MKKILILMILVASMTLFATLNVEIDFDTNVVGEIGDSTYASDYFNITNVGEDAEYVISLNVLEITDDWFITWCHEDLSDVGLYQGCHNGTWTVELPAEATLAINFHVNNMGGNAGMATIEYVITGGDLAQPLIIPFTYQTADYVSNDNSVVPVNDVMLINYPNPFNPETTISYTLNQNSQVQLEVYNVLGQHVATLVNGQQTSGNHTVVWNGKDENNNDLSSGIYLYKLTNGNQINMNKMILMK